MSRMPPPMFIPRNPSVEDCWRGIVLYGGNSTTYKFALAESLLKIRPQAGSLIKLEDLAPVFGQAIAAHMRHSPKQGTRKKPSAFLKSVSAFNEDSDLDKLVDATVLGGFKNVIDAFHNVSSTPVLHKFFVDERKSNKGIRITDEFARLAGGAQLPNIVQEVDSRWRLVETAWNIGLPANHLVVQHDQELGEMFTFDSAQRRRNVTSSRGALNGYQLGMCFYCFADLRFMGGDLNTDVDHFFPAKLRRSHPRMNLDGVWNLVLACQCCNRGVGGKMDRIPTLALLERLSKRNEFLIESRHPLRETLMNQTGMTATLRRDFLNTLYHRVQFNPATAWEPETTFSDDPFLGPNRTDRPSNDRQATLF